MPKDDEDELARELSRAIAARRPAPSRELETRLRAAAMHPPRRSWWMPAGLAGLVAVATVLVLAQRRQRDPDEPRRIAEERVQVVSVPAPAGGGGTSDEERVLKARILELEVQIAQLRLELARARRDDARGEAGSGDAVAPRPDPAPTPRPRSRRAPKAGTPAPESDVMDPFASGKPRVRPRVAPVATPEPDDGEDVLDPFARPGTPAPAAEPTGVLRIATTPFAQVFLDGKLLGTTPLVANLRPGLHRVSLVVKDQHLRNERTIEIEPGKIFRLNVQLESPVE